MLLSWPFFDGTIETLQIIQALMLPLIAGALVALIVGRACFVTPMLHFDMWRTELPSGADDSKEPRWTLESSAGVLVGAATLLVLAYALTHDYFPGVFSDSALIAMTVAALIAALTLLIAATVTAIQSSRGTLTLIYTLILLLWAGFLPLIYWLPSPFNLVVLLFLAVIVSVPLVICCKFTHTTRSAVFVASAHQSDLRLVPSETRFPRHMARWLVFMAFNLLVYTVAFSVTDRENATTENFITALQSVLLAQLLFVIVMLCASCVCNYGSSRYTPTNPDTEKQASVPDVEQKRPSQSWAARPMYPSGNADDDDDDDPLHLPSSSRPKRKAMQRNSSKK
jgi:hypothetical protein